VAKPHDAKIGSQPANVGERGDAPSTETLEPAQVTATATANASGGPKNYTAPSFARDFPRDDALDALVLAFRSGNYRRVHAEAPELALRTTDPAVRDAARTLYQRTEPDPLAKIILLAAVMLLAVMATWWITHSGTRSPVGAAWSGMRSTVGAARSGTRSPVGAAWCGGVSESAEALVES